MGHNLMAACHRCKKQTFCFRHEEDRNLLDFYKKHAECAREDKSIVQTVMDNNGPEPFWEREYEMDEENYPDPKSRTKSW